MDINFYCHICQEFHQGKIQSVTISKIFDITAVTCENCKTESTLYLKPNTIPKITLPKPYLIGEGDD